MANLNVLHTQDTTLVYNNSVNTGGLSIYSGGYIKRGQSFENPNNVEYILNNIYMYFGKTGSPTGNAYIEVYTHSGTFGTSSIGGSLLATSETFDVSALTTGVALHSLSFTGVNRIVISANTKYVIAVCYNGGDSSNCVFLGYREDSLLFKDETLMLRGKIPKMVKATVN